MKKYLLGSDWLAIVGLMIWLLFVFFAPRASEGILLTIENLLALAMLVHLPLAIGQLYRPGDVLWGGDLLHVARQLQPWAAVAALISLMLAPGWLAFLLVLPWLAIGLSLALSALNWLFHNWRRLDYQLIFCAGMLYLPIGAGWLAAYRLGIRPLGFVDLIVLLTAVHFHYTGFVLPLFAALLGRWMRSNRQTSYLYPISSTGIVLAMPLVAAGITFSPVLEVVGVLLLFGSVAGMVWLMTSLVMMNMPIRFVRELFGIAMLCLLTAISLGLLYGLSEFWEQQWLTIPQMVTFHGWLNGIGFAFCGLLGWRIVFPPAKNDGRALLEQEW